MYDDRVRARAAALLAAGLTWPQTSRELGVSRSTLREWQARVGARARRAGCPACDEVPLDGRSYAALLGFYLGDGCLSEHTRYWSLRVSCDARLPGIIDDVARCVQQVRPSASVFRVPAPGAVVVTANWQHWPCLFPQHGPGRKHDRPIVFEDWQRAVIEAHPGPFLRGLFHSDGSRVRNWATRTVAGETKRYDYPRWQFANVSADIRELCCPSRAVRARSHRTISEEVEGAGTSRSAATGCAARLETARPRRGPVAPEPLEPHQRLAPRGRGAPRRPDRAEGVSR